MNWVFLRGWVRDQTHWEDFVEIFERTVPGAKVHCLDHVGMGTERGRISPISVSGMVDDLRARWLKIAGVQTEAKSEPWAIFAVSLGGMCLMDWQDRYPKDFQCGIIVNSSASNLSSMFQRMYPRNYKLVPKFLIERPFGIEREKMIMSVTCQNASAVTKAIKRREEEFQAHPERIVPLKELQSVGLRQLFAASRYKAPQKLSTKNLVIYSEGDTLVNPECSRRIAQHFGAPVKVHSWGGHDLPLDDPQWVSETVRSFIAGA